MTAKLSAYAAAVITLALIVVDIVFATDRVRGNTWSEVIHHWGGKVPVIPWTWGVLLGHFFGRGMVPAPFTAQAGIALLVWATVVVQLVGMSLGVHPLISGLIGIVAGAVCWAV